MTSPSRCVIAGAGPVWASSGTAPASRAAVTKPRIVHPVGFISLLPPSPSGFGEASAVQKLLSGQSLELLAGINEILAVVEFLDQPVVVGGCFCLIGLEERFRQIVVNGVPSGVAGVLFEDLLEAGDGAGVPAGPVVIEP